MAYADHVESSSGSNPLLLLEGKFEEIKARGRSRRTWNDDLPCIGSLVSVWLTTIENRNQCHPMHPCGSGKNFTTAAQKTNKQ